MVKMVMMMMVVMVVMLGTTPQVAAQNEGLKLMECMRASVAIIKSCITQAEARNIASLFARLEGRTFPGRRERDELRKKLLTNVATKNINCMHAKLTGCSGSKFLVA